MGNFYLHEDLMMSVLLRLPAESLFRFKSVSKSWNALISSPNFIKLHLNQTQINPKPNILVYENVWENKIDKQPHRVKYLPTRRKQIHEVNIFMARKNMELGCESKPLHHPRLRHPFDSSGKGMVEEIIGSCNGLICLMSRDECNICLCNPVINSYWELPPNRPLMFVEKICRRISICGFGYDDVHDDYKVVMQGLPKWEYGYNVNEYKVYSLRSNSWSRVRSLLKFIPHFYNGFDGVLVNCALHWILKNYIPSWDDVRKYSSILAFDLRTDKDKILPVPEVLKEEDCLRLSVLNNNLLVLSKIAANPIHDFDLWVMKDYGLKDSWMKITIRNMLHDGTSFTPVPLFEGERNLIIFNEIESKFLLYDLVSHRVIHSGILPQGLYTRHTLHFVESLVQPRP